MVAFRDKPECKAAIEALVGPGIAKTLTLEILRDLYNQLGGDESWTTIKAHDYRRVRELLDSRTAKKAKLMGQPETENGGPTQAQLSEAVRLLCEMMAVPPEYVCQTVTSIYEIYGGQPEAWAIIKEDDWAQVIEYIQNDPARPTKRECEKDTFPRVNFGGPSPPLQAPHGVQPGGQQTTSLEVVGPRSPPQQQAFDDRIDQTAVLLASSRPHFLEPVSHPVRGEPTSVNTPLVQSTRPQSPKTGPPRLGANPGTLSPREKHSTGAQLLESTSSLPLHAGLVRKSQEATEEAQRKRRREREHLEGLRSKARIILGGGQQSPRATGSQAPAKEKVETKMGQQAERCEEGMSDVGCQDMEGRPEQTRTGYAEGVDCAKPQSPSRGSKSTAVRALEHALTRLKEVGATRTLDCETPAQKGGMQSRGGGVKQDKRADVLGVSNQLRGGSANGERANSGSQSMGRIPDGGLGKSQSPVLPTSPRLPASPVQEGGRGLGSDGGAAEGSQRESRRKLDRLRKVGELSPREKSVSGDARKGNGAKTQGEENDWRLPIHNPPRSSKLKSLNAILEKSESEQEMGPVQSRRTGDSENEGKTDRKRRKQSLDRSPPDQRDSPSEKGRHIRMGGLRDKEGASAPLCEEVGKVGEERVVCEDISRGMERHKIRCVNGVTGDGLPPSFRYMSKSRPYDLARKSYLDCLSRLVAEDQCKCEGDCLASGLACCCTNPTRGCYAYGTDGRLTPAFLGNELRRREEGGERAQDFIKECSDLCSCNLQCNNRVVQRGLAVKLEVFWAGSGKGWGVRCLEDLLPGTFVCEYAGEILTTDELEARNKNAGDVHHTYPVELTADPVTEFHVDDESGLCLDATNIGNVARFINHRCGDAPLIDLPVEIEGPDHNYYHVAFFTKGHVEALTELTWDYGTNFDDKNHPVKAFRCICNSPLCRGA